jgi:hypothetical protein
VVIEGIDLRTRLAKEEVAAIRAAWLRHRSSHFLDQQLQPKT